MRRGVLVSFVLLAGCGESKIDGADVERFVREKVNNPAVVESVTCPDERPAKKGDKFECTIEVEDGSQEIVTVEQTDDDGHVRLIADRQTRLPDDRSKLTLKPENLETLISQELPDVVPGTARCPEGEPIEARRVTRCSVRSSRDGKTYVVSIVQFDDLGNVRIQDVKPR